MKVLKCVIHEDHEDYNPIDDEKYPYYSKYEVMTHKLKKIVHPKSIHLITFVWDDIPHFTLGGFDNMFSLIMGTCKD